MMQCTKCGLPLLGDELFCPQCGIQIERPPQPSAPAAAGEAEPAADGSSIVEALDVPLEASPSLPNSEEEAPLARPANRLLGPLGLGILAGCMTIIILGLAALGIIQGLRMRSGKLAQEAEQRYQLGIEHMAKGEFELAVSEFEYALRLRPDYPEAKQKLLEARAALSPTTEATADPTALLAAGRAAYDSGAWDEAIARLEALQNYDPDYEQAIVRQLLAKAYANSGLQLVSDGSLEEAIRRFDQALALQPDNPDVQLQRQLATLYQSGLNHAGVNWGQSIQDFQAVYNLKPDYQDIAQQLPRAYIGAGDAAAANSAWCRAVEYYQSALDLASTPEVAAKRDEAARHCASPTGTVAAPGTYIGTFEGQEDIRQRTTNWTMVQGRVLNAKGEGVPNCQVKISAYDWSVIHTTDGTGYYDFIMLQQEITWTISLPELPCIPVEVPSKFGYSSVADFHEQP